MAQQTATEWKPRGKQAKVLEAAQEMGLNRTIVKVCAEASIAPSTFYRWLKNDPEFGKAWDEIWHGSIRRHLPGVVAAQVKKALAGDTHAARLLVDMAGVIKQKHEHTGKDGATLFEVVVVKPPVSGEDGDEDED